MLTAMNRVQSHRGPDGEGTWHDPATGVGLAHRRLAIIDLSDRGLQPMQDASGRLRITYNGEIYNYRELRLELESTGFVFRSDSDTEVILNLLRRDGPSGLARLNGMFAFALWDVHEKTLLLARDPAGVKPLYYAYTPSGFIFASELKALRCAPDLDLSLDLEAMTHYLSYLYTPGSGTMLRAVRKLPPGHSITVANLQPRAPVCYAGNPYEQAVQHDMSAQDAIATTEELLRRAVQRQMVADVPVGAFLSGGLDSSAVVAFAREHAGQSKLQCFTIANSEGESEREGWADDYPYAQRVAAHLGVELNTIEVGPEMAASFGWMISQLDEPQADPAALNTYFIARLARERGIKVLLSGAGGDDIFSGYRRHFALETERFWGWLPRPARQSLGGAARCLPQAHPFLRRASKALQYARLEPDERIAAHFLWLRPELLHSVLAPDVRAALARCDVLSPMIQALRTIPNGTPRLNKMLFLEGRHFLADHNLNYTDKMSMAAGVEVRVPFLDPDLVSFAARLPVGFKQNGAVGKWVLRKAMKQWLPADVIYRPKTGFGVPLRRWMRHDLRGLIDDTLAESSLIKRGLFCPHGVRDLVEKDRRGVVDASYPILALVCIELWCRGFLDWRQ